MRTMFIGLMLVCSCADAEQVRVTHGPMLGRLSATGIGVWARTSQSTELRVRYGTVAGKLDRVSPAVPTKLENDNTGWIHLVGLKPRTRYFYQVVAGDGKSGPGGSFRTLPSSEQFKHVKLNPKGLFNFRFEFACGNNQSPEHGNGPSMPTYTTMLREIKDKVDFAILNGDWLYEEDRDYSPEKWLAQIGIKKEQAPHNMHTAPTIVGVWENYKTYLARPKNLAEWHRHVPSYFTFDDHEIVNDVYGSGEIGRRDRRAVYRDVAIEAWFDYLGWSNPTVTTQGIYFGRAALRKDSDILIDARADFTKIDLTQAANLHVLWGGPQAGIPERFYTGGEGDPNAGVYEIVRVLDKHRVKINPAARATGAASYSIGRQSYGKFRVSNCDFYLLDTRTNRQMHDVRHPDKKGVTMLGVRQREWLMKEMKASDADFFFIASSVNFMIPHVGGGGVKFDVNNKDDAWTVFLDEREQLIEAWDSLNKRVCVLTGDLHNSFVIKITDRVWEFASGPHNSNNHWYTDEGNRPATGPFQYGPRKCDIRWSSFFRDDIPRSNLLHPFYCVVQVNNVFNNPIRLGEKRWVVFERP
ncbi:MAG: alkaline phosphatase D family protein, partial [Planctomycetes bacterium]|nr:alkaline phosphatase D family protein [Planctomycetota bacterium]